MDNRRNSDSGDNSFNSFLRRFSAALENRVVMLFVASVIGTAGGIGIQNIKSVPNHDFFTGTEGRILQREISGLKSEVRDIQHRLQECVTRVTSVESDCRQVLLREKYGVSP